MFLSDLQKKQVISIINGKNMGRIVDAKLDNTGKIIQFIAEEKRFFLKFFKNTEKLFTYQDIAKIGEDCILVNK